jgi:predicted DCC family thiol-disulfide oxidoreductase YuxK
MTQQHNPVFVYDGDCAFCSSCARFIERWIPTRAAVVPWQFSDLGALGLTQQQAEAAVQWVDPSRSVIAAGPDGIAAMLRDAGKAWWLIGSALRLRPVRAVAWPAYRWLANHRHLMPGGTAACSLPQSARDRLYGGADS